MAVIKIETEKPEQEFEIANKVYTVTWDDASLERYEKQINHFRELAENMPNVEGMAEEEKEKVKAEQRQMMKATIDTFFGSGSFKEIYRDTGRSMMNLVKVVEAVAVFLGDKIQSTKADKRKKYTGK